MKLTVSLLGGVAATLLTVAMLFTAGWVRPPILGLQTGFRGTGQQQLISASDQRIMEAANALPAPIDKASAPGLYPSRSATIDVWAWSSLIACV